MNKNKNKIINCIERINKLEEGLSLFEENDEEYISVLAKTQSQYDLIADAAMEGFKELTLHIRNTGNKRVQRGIDQLPLTIKETVSDQINEFKEELKGELFE
ncbi:hypothetical protein [Bacillus atrophaeus]|uniref:hypothetical protein n=1 Tax=Bacillus atrophaeus TaxID=1452 RepID=UPI002DB6BC75|nr:hypothetical protein [Bacillus atrophaeus]MEC2307745.1 hypothetical protein [Bacillus atrophaeus]